MDGWRSKSSANSGTRAGKVCALMVLASALGAAPVCAQLRPGAWAGWPGATLAAPLGGVGAADATGLAGDWSLGLSGGPVAYSLQWGTRYQLGLGMTLPRSDAGLQSAGQGLKPRLPATLYAEPGYALGTATLLYGRLSYAAGRWDDAWTPEAGGRAFGGLGLGAGVRTQFGEHLFLQFELQLNAYDWQGLGGGLLRPQSAGGSVGLGWRF